MRDYARVLYSSSFRRLQGKMQLLGVSSTDFTRNRLTHSLEVAQLSRNIAADLGVVNPVVAETCALLHDIGNPPFGHKGEKVIHELLVGGAGGFSGSDGYEGNAQTLRIIRTLEKKSSQYCGLNLTARTMFGVVKYLHKSDQNNSKFLYNEDYDFVIDTLSKNSIGNEKSIDAQIMDLSDEIAYAAHDLEDALSEGLISIGELLHEFKISEKYKGSYSIFESIVKESQKEANGAHLLKTSEEYSAIFRKELTSKIVNTLCRDIGLVGKGAQVELGYKNYANLAMGLKKLVFTSILRKNDIQEYEIRGEKVIRGLFDVYCDESFNKGLMLLPAELRGLNCSTGRKVADYVSGMMDAFAIQEYVKYFGEQSYRKLYVG